MNVKHSLEYLVCFFSKHDFLVSPEYVQDAKCQRCHRPYAETLRDKWQRRKHKPIELRTEASSEKVLVVSGIRK